MYIYIISKQSYSDTNRTNLNAHFVNTEKYFHLIRLMRINQPTGFFLLLWPTLWGLWIANKGVPNFFLLTLFTLGTIFMRSAGCVINDYIDCNIDNHVKRTKHRPLSDKTITKKKARITFFILIIISSTLVLNCNITTILVSSIALVLTIIYPYLKRYFSCPQLILGILFSWPIIMAFTASNQSLNTTAWLLFIANTIWTISYDTQYAMIDRDDDQRIKIKSSALLFGKKDKLTIGILQFITVCIFSIIGWKEQYSIMFYFFSVFGVTILYIWQQILIYYRTRKGCYQAFLNNKYVGLLIFIGIILNYI